jgi:drug/metabolite transporter (DMT)-like permease
LENIRGAVIMVFAMAGFAIEDMFIKQMAGAVPTGEIILFLCLGGIVTFGGMMIRQGNVRLRDGFTNRYLWLRNFGELIGTVGFVTAITTSPLSTASAILQANPLLVTLGAALFFAEPVGWRRWTAIFVGLCGVLLVIRPFGDGFVPASLFAVQGVLGLSLRDLATRRIPKSIPSSLVSVTAFITLIPAGIAMMWVAGAAPVWPDATNSARLLGAVVIGGVAYYGIVMANRIGDISAIAPFRYSRIIFALVIAYVAFDERPDILTLIGAGTIVASGLYTLFREAQLRRAFQNSPAAL